MKNTLLSGDQIIPTLIQINFNLQPVETDTRGIESKQQILISWAGAVFVHFPDVVSLFSSALDPKILIEDVSLHSEKLN